MMGKPYVVAASCRSGIQMSSEEMTSEEMT
jgi:hypothetical protein